MCRKKYALSVVEGEKSRALQDESVGWNPRRAEGAASAQRLLQLESEVRTKVVPE